MHKGKLNIFYMFFLSHFISQNKDEDENLCPNQTQIDIAIFVLFLNYCFYILFFYCCVKYFLIKIIFFRFFYYYFECKIFLFFN
jgi:hypothetical protein